MAALGDSSRTSFVTRVKESGIRSHPDGIVGMFIYTMVLFNLIQQQVLHDALVREHNGNTSHMMNATCKSFSDNSTQEEEYQKATSELLIDLACISLIPMSVATVVGGGLADLSGKRKMLMIIPILGQMVQMSSLLLIIYTTLPVKPIVYIAQVIIGLSGSYGLLTVGAYSFLTDRTRAKDRTWRMIIMESMMAIGLGLSVITGGPLADAKGLAAVAVLGLSLAAVNCFYVVIILKDHEKTDPLLQKQPVNEEQKSLSFCSRLLYGLKTSLELFQGKRDVRRGVLIFAVVAYALFILLENGSSLFVLILRYQPFCLSNTEISLFQGELIILAVPLVGLSLVLVKKYHFRDESLIAIGFLSMCAEFSLFGGAMKKIMVYFVPIGGAFQPYILGASRSMMSKAVPDDVQGVLFGFMGIVITVSQVVGIVMADQIYAMTVTTSFHLPNPGSVLFFSMAGISMGAFIGSMIMKCVKRSVKERQPKGEYQSTSS
eukprot:m.130294 g.130294  ORF g.130294 m.130294 type:complete len:489 (+) comp38015_c0_seq1:120-1586(+)